jgi:uncharacterized protein (TIGR03437 family)
MHQPHIVANPSFFSKSLRFALGATLLLGVCFALLRQPTAHARLAQNAVATVSAASFEPAALAPGAIVAAFGASLATGVEVATTLPLPTTLGGTTALVKDSAGVERAAALFFVSPNQVNFAIPLNSAVGTATLTVTTGNGTISQGPLEIKAVAPAIFTANADGLGAPAAVLLRVAANGQQSFETAAQFDAVLGRQRPRPIDLSPTGDRVYLILFLTGTQRAADTNGDGNRNETVHLLLGGTEVTPDFVGPQGTLVGLDQMNVELPRALIGSGRISLSVTGTGLTSNLVELEISSAPGSAPPAVTGFNAAQALAGTTLVVQGNGFATQAANNLVRIGGFEAVVTNATASSLTVLVPFGVESGVVSVRTPTGEGYSNNPLQIRTSISGLVENTERQPMKDVKVRLRGTNNSFNTSNNGGFVLPDPPTNVPFSVIEVDGSQVPVNPPYGKLTLLTAAVPNRDNQFARPITLQQINGASAQVGGNLREDEEETTLTIPAFAAAGPDQTPPQIQNGNVTLGLPSGMKFQFPDGATGGVMALTQVANSRLPASLPNGIFSSTVVQITPFGTRMTPGGRMTFPNSDGYPAGATVRIYRLDQTPDSPTLGRIVSSGTATVSADGQTIFAPNGSIPEATYYFVALERATTTVIGRVLDNDRSPLRRTLVRCRGQEDFTDGNGGFVLRNVSINSNGDPLVIEASLVRANGRVDRVQSNPTNAVSSGVTNAGTLMMPASTSNQPPIILISPQLTVNAGETREFAFVADDPDSGQTVRLTLSGASFATLLQNPPALRLAPSFNDTGSFTLTLIATDNQGATTTRNLTVTVLKTNRAPVANAQTVTLDEDTSRAITLTSSDPDNDSVNYIVVSAPAHGTLSGSGAARTYTPNANFNGADSFTFKVNDSLLDSNTATVGITVNPVNDRPVLTVPGAQTVNAGALLTFTVTATDVDSGQTLTYSATGLPSGASFNPSTRQFSWTPTGNQAGSSTVSFTVTDNGTPVLSDTKQVSLTVVNEAFTVHDHRITGGPIPEGCATPVAKTVFSATDAQAFQWTLIAGASIGDVVRWDFIQPNGSIYTTDSLTLTFSGGACFWKGINILGQPAAQLFGRWQVKVYYKNALVVTDEFSITTTTGINVVGHVTSASDPANDCTAPALKTAFSPNDPRVYQWTRLSGIKNGDSMRWDFIQPNGAVYFTRSITVEFTGEACFWSFFNLAGGEAAHLPGNWQARVYYQGALLLTDNFSIAAALNQPLSKVNTSPTRGGGGGGNP